MSSPQPTQECTEPTVKILQDYNSVNTTMEKSASSPVPSSKSLNNSVRRKLKIMRKSGFGTKKYQTSKFSCLSSCETPNKRVELSDISSEELSKTEKPNWLKLDHKFIERNNRDKIKCIKNSNLYKEILISKRNSCKSQNSNLRISTFDPRTRKSICTKKLEGSSFGALRSENTPSMRSEKLINMVESKHKRNKAAFLPDLKCQKPIKSLPKGIMEKLMRHHKKSQGQFN